MPGGAIAAGQGDGHRIPQGGRRRAPWPAQAAAVGRLGRQPAADFAALVADVRQRGVIHPILLWDTGDGPQAAEGWHSYIATRECGRECPAVEYQGDILSLADVAESENRHHRQVPDRYAIGRAVARVRVASAVAGVAGDRLSVGDVADRLCRSQRHYPTARAPARTEPGIVSPAGGRPREEPSPVAEQYPGPAPALEKSD